MTAREINLDKYERRYSEPTTERGISMKRSNCYAITTVRGTTILWGYMPWGVCPLKYGTLAECLQARYNRGCK